MSYLHHKGFKDRFVENFFSPQVRSTTTLSLSIQNTASNNFLIEE